MLPLFTDLPAGLAAFRPAPNPHPYQLPAPVCWPVVRWTAQRVIVRVGERATPYDPAGLIAVANDAAWTALLETYTAYQTALTTLAARLRDLGSYSTHLAAATAGGGAVPNPLTPTVLGISDPQHRYAPGLTHDWTVPVPRRVPALRHTPQMLETAGGFHGQRDYFPCPDEATFQAVAADHAAAQVAGAAWTGLLAAYGPLTPPAPDRLL